MIVSYSETRRIVEKHNLRIKKKFGQNFLIDPHVLNKIINGSEVSKDDYVIEIGAGIGGLTEALAEKASGVTAIEIDKDLIPVLKENLARFDNVEIVNQNILDMDLANIVQAEGKNIKFIANLPYYISTSVIMKLLESGIKAHSIVVMIQKEVGHRIQALPNTKDYGSLSIAAQYYADPLIIANTPRNCFFPRPNVDSVVIKLTLRKEKKVKVVDEDVFFSMVKAGFHQRRKTLLNSLANYKELNLDKEQAMVLIEKCGLDTNIRGEALTIENYADLANEYINII